MKTVYISNLSYQRDQTGIKNLFSRYGKIKNVTIILHTKTQLPTGMAFIEMDTEEQALKAIQVLNNQIIDGRTLKTKFAFQQRNPENNTYKPNPLNKKSPLKFKKEAKRPSRKYSQ